MKSHNVHLYFPSPAARQEKDHGLIMFSLALERMHGGAAQVEAP